MTDRDRHLDRLAKLLALARSPNAHESESARRAAEALMLRHGLRAEEASGRLASGYYEYPMGARGWNSKWRFALVTAAARHCGAEAVGLLVGQRCKVRVVGVRSDVERAVELYERLLEVVLSLGRDFQILSWDQVEEAQLYGSRECTDAFRRGAVLGIIVLLAQKSGEPLFRDHHVPREAEGDGPRGDSTALARVEEGKTGRARARAKYDPEERDLALDDVVAFAWFGAGVESAKRVVVSDDGSVSLKQGGKS